MVDAIPDSILLFFAHPVAVRDLALWQEIVGDYEVSEDVLPLLWVECFPGSATQDLTCRPVSAMSRSSPRNSESEGRGVV